MNGPVPSPQVRHVRLLTLLPLSILLLGLLFGWLPGTGRANTTTTSRVYLPLLLEGGTARASLTGRVRFWSDPQPAIIRPVRYLVVLDVSGSMNFSFDGQGKQAGVIKQCANSADPDKDKTRVECLQTWEWAWEPLAERRTYVARQAINQLIGMLNIPGNAGYDETIPQDQMRLVAFEKRIKATTDWSSDKATLLNDARTVGQYGDYTTSGGTNGAAGLYQAALFLAEDNTFTDDDGYVYPYKTVVIFVTDGLSNYFLVPEAPGFGVMPNDQSSMFPADNACAKMPSSLIKETVACQVNETAGGPYVLNGTTYDRPISAMINTSRNLLHSNGHAVYVIAVSAIPDTGLKDGVASSPEHYQEARSLEVNIDTGLNNVDEAFQRIAREVDTQRESDSTEGTWLDTITPKHRPDGLPEGLVGIITLTNAQQLAYSVPITVDPTDTTGYLTYSFDEIPVDTYTLRAMLFYKDSNNHLNTYSMIFQTENDTSTEAITVTLKPDEERTLAPLALMKKPVE